MINPPRNGEGDREAVEGPVAGGRVGEWRSPDGPDPSVSAAGCHLRVPGRIV